MPGVQASVDAANSRIDVLRAQNSALTADLASNDKLSGGTREQLGTLGVLSAET